MNENSIPPISGIRAVDPGTPAKTLTQAQSEIIAPTPEKSPKPLENESQHVSSMPNTSIHFQVDNETNELVVIVIDQKSKRVLRSIPASELHKLQAGELLKLTA